MGNGIQLFVVIWSPKCSSHCIRCSVFMTFVRKQTFFDRFCRGILFVLRFVHSVGFKQGIAIYYFDNCTLVSSEFEKFVGNSIDDSRRSQVSFLEFSALSNCEFCMEMTNVHVKFQGGLVPINTRSSSAVCSRHLSYMAKLIKLLQSRCHFRSARWRCGR